MGQGVPPSQEPVVRRVPLPRLRSVVPVLLAAALVGTGAPARADEPAAVPTVAPETTPAAPATSANVRPASWRSWRSS